MEYGGHLWTDKGHLSVIQNVMVKTIQSSFPPCPTFDGINVHFDKLNNTDLLLQCNGFI